MLGFTNTIDGILTIIQALFKLGGCTSAGLIDLKSAKREPNN
jgi:hypothetical protein